MLWRWPNRQRFSRMTWRRLRGRRYPTQSCGRGMAANGQLATGLTLAGATQDQTSVCSAISNVSSTSIPRYGTVLSSFVCAHLLLA